MIGRQGVGWLEYARRPQPRCTAQHTDRSAGARAAFHLLATAGQDPRDEGGRAGETGLLVTGATGFTGRKLAERLLGESLRVRAMVRRSSDAHDLERMGADLVVAGLRDPSSVRRAVEGVDVVYHLAGIFREASESRRKMFEVNVEETRSLLDAGVTRFAHCSTVGVHGDVKNPPADEAAPYAPGDIYQESKLEAELSPSIT